MALFGKSSVKQSGVVKHRSTLGMLLNPDIGASISPLRDTMRIFVNLLAMIFCASGMFPRNHPAFTDSNIHISLSEVMGTAWKSLRPTTVNIPRYFLFFGVLSALIFGAVAIFIVAASLLIGHAHAQAPTDTTTTTGTTSNSFFSPVDSSQDLVLAWLNFLFKGQAVYNYLGYGQTVPQLTTVQQALMTGLAFYADAILVVAAFVLFYHLTTMIISTAHHGEIMGKKADKVWAPIRLVVALGLLVPVAGGLSSGQMIVVQVAQWGSNLAGQTWKIFMDSLASQDQSIGQTNPPDAHNVVYNTVMSAACVQVYNALINGMTSSGSSGTSCTATNNPPPMNQSLSTPLTAIGTKALTATLADQSTVNYFGAPGSITADSAVCGGYLYLPAKPDTLGGQIASGRQTTYISMQSSATQFVQKYLPYFIPVNVGGCDGSMEPPNNLSPATDFDTLVENYEDSISSTFNGYMNSGGYASMMQTVAQASSAQGWISAGAWFNTVARIQGETARISEMMPGTAGPNISRAANSELAKEMQPILDKFAQFIAQPNVAAVSTNTTMSQAMTDSSKIQLQVSSESPVPLEYHFLDRFFAAIDWIAGKAGIWVTALCSNSGQANQNCSTANTSNLQNISGNYQSSSNALAQNLTGNQPSMLGVQFTTANPFAEIANFGMKNLKAASMTFDLMIDMFMIKGELDAASGIVKIITGFFGKLDGGLSKTIVGELHSAGDTMLATIAGLMSTIAFIFFSCGFMLTFFLPMIPFMRFFFRAIAWILIVLEAVIVIPLVALAHLDPEGEGLPGQAKVAYQMIFSMFLVPVLTVFGLIVGLLIFSAAVGLLNLLYLQAVVGAGGTAHEGFMFLSRMVYTVLYVFCLYVSANNCFKMIQLLPEQAFDWMGIRSVNLKPLGDPDDFQQGISIVSELGAQKIFDQASQLGKGKVAPLAVGTLLVGTKGMGEINREAGDVAKRFASGAAGAIAGPGAADAVAQGANKVGGAISGAVQGTQSALDKADKLPKDNIIRQGADTVRPLVKAAGEFLGVDQPPPATDPNAKK